MVHTYLEWVKVAYSVNMELLGGGMNNCEQHCDCVFTKEEIEKYSINNYGNFVDLTKQQSYRMSSGLTREEKRMFILNSTQKEGER